jgi:hypothetical protein
MNKDTEHLQLLSIFHYVVGGLALLCACFPLIHVTIGSIFILAGSQTHATSDAPPIIVGWILVFFGLVLFAFGLLVGAAVLWTGHCLTRRAHYHFCFAIACIECLFMPFGTVLGVFTLVVLSRDSVKRLFFPSPATPS